ncbi:alpha/beta-hydrolase [Coccomyxa subellipsoidea C-169]|uniref:sn-1-specific diacylglycerol lipase n=1 Tax=Coccomyxa subellipsoidea (strain C-169) TaxID=574566 RepID=I0Z8N8_COCSC|nr:alpha/beta-hydrolase [Coccomyxa subellipsoidea C-169]EIE27007.1 alpha/beta-hydrolase [Coccomyxa subellipsoidea C-169]|eukprot:XP_005651551.1 alpha/beta-hydrolase [Coccomyxa subellipsoidea C-169]
MRPFLKSVPGTVIAAKKDPLADVFFFCTPGTPLEVSKRRFMGPLVDLQFALWTLQLGIAIYGTWVVADVRLRLPGDACWFIYNRKTAVHFLVYFMWVHLVYNWARIFIIYNIFPTFDSVRSWRRRLACVAIIMRSHEALASLEERLGTRRLHEISELYAAIIRGVDLTPTDQMDALILLNGLQQIRRLTHVVDKLKAALGIPAEERLPPDLKPIPELARHLNQQHRNDSTRQPDSPEAAFEYAESMEQGRAANADTRLQSSLDTAHCLTPTGHHETVPREELRDASNFVRFAMAAYSTQAYTWQVGSYWKGMLQLLFGRRWRASRANLLNRDHIRTVGQRVQYEAILRLAQIDDTDLLDEPLGTLPYIIALDRVSRSVVVAVRGTWSLADFVTDIVAVPHEADWWLPPSLQQKQQQGRMEGVYAHSGVLSAAATIWKDMEEHGILSVLLSGNRSLDQPSGQDMQQLGEGGHARGKYAAEIARMGLKGEGWRLVVTGHSLGAGVAALLSLKMLDQYPRLKCWAYSPPGGLVSPNLSPILAGFCCGVAVAKDSMPRLTLKNLDRLLDKMIVALARSNMHTLRREFILSFNAHPGIEIVQFSRILLGALSKKRRRKRLRKLFRPPDEVPAEALRFLFRRHSAEVDPRNFREMLPPGRMLFVRRLKRLRKMRRHREKWQIDWDAVHVAPEEIVREMLSDHRLHTLNEAIKMAEGVDPDEYTRAIQAAKLPDQQDQGDSPPPDTNRERMG